ncbi:MAG: menaquinone biosynthesis protein [Proteobacteria bacterium]|nr:menaquinone biosynthesis protein [Pseudomonadota bacterium]MBU1740307.1 menaquinone biosynthesis protein [Pseudomonadota bacterium]
MSGRRVRLGRIGYVNVAPIYFGLDNGLRPDWLEIVPAGPTELNRMLAAGDLDVSPVSSVAYARAADDWLLLPDLAVGCWGEVGSVFLVSTVPLTALTDCLVVLTEESATAAALLRIILAARGIRPNYRQGTIDQSTGLPSDAAAALVIGDTALGGRWSERYPHVYDLGRLWHDLTGLPFVFAVWAVRRSFAEDRPRAAARVAEMLGRSRAMGRRNMKAVVASSADRLKLFPAECARYFDGLVYDLGPDQVAALEVFFNRAFLTGQIPGRVVPRFFEPPHPSGRRR